MLQERLENIRKDNWANWDYNDAKEILKMLRLCNLDDDCIPPARGDRMKLGSGKSGEKWRFHHNREKREGNWGNYECDLAHSLESLQVYTHYRISYILFRVITTIPMISAMLCMVPLHKPAIHSTRSVF